MHNESPLAPCRVEPCSTDEKQPTNGRLYNSAEQPTGRVDRWSTGEMQPSGRVDRWSTGEMQPTNGRLYQQRQRARRTALWVGAIAVLVYVGFILSGVIGR